MLQKVATVNGVVKMQPLAVALLANARGESLPKELEAP